MTRRWTVEIDYSRCVGNGLCTAIAPSEFRLVDGRAQSTAGPREPTKEIVEAWESCPVSAVLVRDESGAEIEPTPMTLLEQPDQGAEKS